MISFLYLTVIPCIGCSREDHCGDRTHGQGWKSQIYSGLHLPLTGKNVVDMIVTDLAVFQRADHQSPFKLIEMASRVTADEVRAKTTAHYLS